MRFFPSQAVIASCVLSDCVTAQDCPVNLQSSYPAPVVAAGYSARLIVGGLSSPRGILFDKNKNLLVVEARRGIKHITFSSDDGATCIAVGNTKTLVSDSNVS